MPPRLLNTDVAAIAHMFLCRFFFIVAGDHDMLLVMASVDDAIMFSRRRRCPHGATRHAAIRCRAATRRARCCQRRRACFFLRSPRDEAIDARDVFAAC